jgi:hypothetical protein
LAFEVSTDLSRVTGTERVRFVPDVPVREVVFRLTPNTPSLDPKHGSVTVQRASASPGGGRFRYERARAAADTVGGLLVIPLAKPVPAGQAVTADVAFTLRLGPAGFDQFGHTGQMAWFGSGQPLFAWERSVGWHREDLAQVTGESATSEAADTDLTVTAPASETVLTNGTQDPPVDAGPGRLRWHATAPTARDVLVTVGELHTTTADVQGVRLTVGAIDRNRLQPVLGEIKRSITELTTRFGPFPFRELAVTQLPGTTGGGIEFPGAILLSGDDRDAEVHEVAHQWFYAMVGNDQYRDPWLDEAFATYAEQLVNGDRRDPTFHRPARVGAAINDFAQGDEYAIAVYVEGASVVFEARDAGGAGAFDDAIRCYLATNAWRIAHPADLAKALADVPAALDVLHREHALS